MKKILLTLGAVATVAVPITLMVSCSSSSEFPGLKANSNGISTDYILNKEEYNKLYHKLDDDHVGIAIIAHHEIYEDIVKVTSKETIEQVLDASKYHFRRDTSSSYGSFLNSFAIKPDLTKYYHGTRTTKNYGDYYPLFYVNGKFSQMGASGFTLEGHEMIEISYDDK